MEMAESMLIVIMQWNLQTVKSSKSKSEKESEQVGKGKNE